MHLLHSAMAHTNTLINVRKHNYFIIRGYMFRPFKRSSSGLLTDPVYMLGSQYVYIDNIHKIRQVSYVGRSDTCIAELYVVKIFNIVVWRLSAIVSGPITI